MEKSIIGPRTRVTSGVVEGSIEVVPPHDQLSLSFDEEPALPSPNDIQHEPVTEVSIGEDVHDSEIVPPTGMSLADLYLIHLEEPQPLLYGGAAGQRLPLDKYRLNKRDRRDFVRSNNLSGIFEKPFDEESKAEVRKSANALYVKYLEGRSYPDMLATCYDLIRILTGISVDLFGQGTKNEQWRLMLLALPETIIAHHDLTPEDRKYFLTYLNTALKKEDGYHKALLYTFDVIFTNYEGSRQYAKRSESIVTDILAKMLEKEQQELRRMTDTFFQEAVTQWTSGIKSSMFQDEDSLFHEPSETGVIMNPTDAPGSLAGVLARFYIAERDDVIAKGLVGVSEKDVQKIARGVNITSVGTPFSGKLAWALGTDAEFYLLPVIGVNRISVRELYRRIGQEPYYDLFRCAMIARIRDMMVPAESVSRMPTHGDFARDIRNLAEGGSDGELMTVVRKFLIPRQEYDRNAGQQNRDRESEEQEIQRVLGERVTHMLKGKIYKLPTGHHRSQYAEDNLAALEVGGRERLEALRREDPTGERYGYCKPHPHDYYVKSRVIPQQKSDTNKE